MLRKIVLIFLTLVLIVVPIINPQLLFVLYAYASIIFLFVLIDLFYIRRRLKQRHHDNFKVFKCPNCKKKSFRVSGASIHKCTYCKIQFVHHSNKGLVTLEAVEMDYYKTIFDLFHYVIGRDEQSSESQPEFLERLKFYLLHKDQDKVKLLNDILEKTSESNLRRILYDLNQHDLPYSVKQSIVKVLLDLTSLDHPIKPSVYRAIKKLIHYYDFSHERFDFLKKELSKRNEFPIHLDIYNLLFNRLVKCSDHPDDFDYDIIRRFYKDIGFEQRFVDRCQNRIEEIESKKRLYIVAKQIYNGSKSKAFSHHLLETVLRFILKTQTINKIQERDIMQITKGLKISNEEYQLIKDSL